MGVGSEQRGAKALDCKGCVCVLEGRRGMLELLLGGRVRKVRGSEMSWKGG